VDEFFQTPTGKHLLPPNKSVSVQAKSTQHTETTSAKPDITSALLAAFQS